MQTRPMLAASVLLLAVLGTPACGRDEQQQRAPAALDAVMPQLQPGVVQPGDVLVSINGQPVSSRADAVRAMQSIKPGDVAEIGIDRAGELITLTAGPRR